MIWGDNSPPASGLSTHRPSHYLYTMFAHALLVLALAPLVAAQCPANVSVPLDPSVVGLKAQPKQWCSRGIATSEVTVKVEAWGVELVPSFPRFILRGGGPACGEEIVALFKRSDMPAMLLFRPAVPSFYFKAKFPELYRRSLTDPMVPFPCDIIPVQELHVWGPRRTLFITLLKKMITSVKFIRDFDCPGRFGPPDRPLPPFEVNELLLKQKITNNALAYLYNVAFSNFICLGNI